MIDYCYLSTQILKNLKLILMFRAGVMTHFKREKIQYVRHFWFKMRHWGKAEANFKQDDARKKKSSQEELRFESESFYFRNSRARELFFNLIYGRM